MTIKQKLYLFFLLSTFNLNSQNNSFLLSSSTKKEKDNLYVFGIDNNSFYTYYNTIDETLLYESFSIDNMKSNGRVEIKLPKLDGKKLKFEQIIYIKGRIYLFTTLYDKKNKINTAYANEITINGEIKAESVKIDEILESKDDNFGQFTFSLSNDSSNVLVFKTHNENSSGEIQGVISYKILDSDLKPLFSNKIELERPLTHYIIKDIILDNNNLYYLKNEPKHNKEVNDYRMKYQVCTYNFKESKLYESEIDIKENHMLDASIMLSHTGQLICTGSYATDKMFDGNWMRIRCLKGVFYVAFDKNNLGIISKNKKNIEEALSSDKLYRYFLSSSFFLRNNQLIVICEFRQTLLTSSIGSGSDSYSSSYESPIATSFNLNNKNESWTKLIENNTKNNKWNCGGTMSYILFKKLDSFSFIYNCNRQIKLDSKGNLNEQYIFTDSQEFKEEFRSSHVSSYFQTNFENIILSTYSKKNGDRYTKLTIE